MYHLYCRKQQHAFLLIYQQESVICVNSTGRRQINNCINGLLVKAVYWEKKMLSLLMIIIETPGTS